MSLPGFIYIGVFSYRGQGVTGLDFCCVHAYMVSFLEKDDDAEKRRILRRKIYKGRSKKTKEEGES